MLAPSIPAEEQERLASLRALEILDTPPEDRFDRITRLLTRVFRVPMAFLSLVDAERQWFKSSVGLEVIETPRNISFCGHAILQRELMVVPDALEDERFRDNPLVTGEPGVRFYAGHPLIGPGGHVIGTLCIADRKPRELDEVERKALRDIARLVERELGLVEVVGLQRELIAARSRAASAERERTAALESLVASQRHLVRELNQAAAYVRSILPEPLSGPPIRATWRYEPSSTVGGDSLGYAWLDADHFAIYLLDVSGHGVGAALLSVSVSNALRSQSLQGVDFRRPDAVLAALNAAFPMDRHDGKYFTIWYGVYDVTERRLTYASGGHPAALLREGPKPTRWSDLATDNFAIGMVEEVPFVSESIPLEPGARLYVFSDGVFEIEDRDGRIQGREDFAGRLRADDGVPRLERIWEETRAAACEDGIRDDFSLLEVEFG